MARFVIRNYGPSRQIPYKGQQLCLSNDQSIETDDEEEAAAFEAYEAIHVTDRGSELAPPLVEESVEESKEVSYEGMTVKELQVIAKDREIKTSGLNKADLIEALGEYDAEEVLEEVIS